jgi:hypothetical protein
LANRQWTSAQDSLVFGAGSYFLTTDYYLYKFDWQKLRERNSMGTVILSNQFMQLLRPFVPSDYELDKSFVEIFAIAEFRTVVKDYTSTATKVFSYLATYADVSEQTAVRILTDEMLSQQLRDIDEGTKKFHELVESAIFRDNEKLRLETENLRAKESGHMALLTTKDKELKLKENELRRLEAEKSSTVDELEDAKAAAERRALEVELSSKSLAERVETEKRNQEQTMNDLQRRLRNSALAVRLVSALAFATLALIGTLFAPKYLAWSWLENHPNKVGLHACAIAIVIGISWAIADQKRRNLALYTLFVPTLIALLQILGR